ncbi:MAG TPA: hypothetical protein VGH92_04965 [Gaiellaceae bacterium]
MADVPEKIDLRRHRDLEGRRGQIWWRRGLTLALLAFLVAGLANEFGQAQDVVRAGGGSASLELSAPAHLRGGLLYTVRFTITARRDVKNAVLELSPGWADGLQINTIEPSPLGQASRNGDMLFTLGHIPAGRKYVLFMGFQVNPTNVGSHNADVTLYDGGKQLVHIDRTVTVFP